MARTTTRTTTVMEAMCVFCTYGKHGGSGFSAIFQNSYHPIPACSVVVAMIAVFDGHLTL